MQKGLSIAGKAPIQGIEKYRLPKCSLKPSVITAQSRHSYPKR